MKTLRDASKVINKKMQGLELQVASDAKATTHLATLVKYHRLHALCMIA